MALMQTPARQRLGWWLWLLCVAAFVAVNRLPVSNRATRFAQLFLGLALWGGLLMLLWRRRPVRWVFVAISGAVAMFLAWPGREEPSPEPLQSAYVEALRRYDGVIYAWGGEGSTGIDCSGLVRRALLDACWHRGWKTGNPALVREAISIWWNDTTARALGQCPAGLTVSVGEATSLNALDHSIVRPGDLAVTKSGVHVLAHLGEKEWIQADPGALRVLRATAPDKEEMYYQVPVRLVRWSLLSSD